MTDQGTINPTETDDVAFATEVEWTGTPGTANLAWTVDNGLAGTLEVAADTLSATLVTAEGAISCVVSVGDPATGLRDTITVSRGGGGGTSTISALNLSATLVPKAGTPPPVATAKGAAGPVASARARVGGKK